MRRRMYTSVKRTMSLIVLLALIIFCPALQAFADGGTDNVDTSSGGIAYVTPEQFGAKGDGVTDDTAAFEKCMKASAKYIVLNGKYLISRYITANRQKYFYAQPKNGYAGASIICNIKYDSKALSFTNVTFENVEFYSTLLKNGTSPHGEKYSRTSNTVFVEVWSGYGVFKNCHFINALIAIRGRKSSSSTIIPQKITVDNCSFTECKIPIQGYCVDTEISDSTFINDGELFRKYNTLSSGSTEYNGDVYSGDHCVYMEAYGCKAVNISNCKVSTLNSQSGASFQIYGKQGANDTIPSLTIDSCMIDSNGVVSASKANVVINNTLFNEQKAEQYILWLESGSADLLNSVFNHTYAFSYSSTTVKPYASDCTFRLLTTKSKTRCNFPYVSKNCNYINWGGNVKVTDTSFTGCVFSFESASALNNLYINNREGKKISIVNTKFKKGPVITNNVSAVAEYSGCSTY